jgi:hypothetical protein
VRYEHDVRSVGVRFAVACHALDDAVEAFAGA